MLFPEKIKEKGCKEESSKKEEEIGPYAVDKSVGCIHRIP
jgi:hypothetical protein